MDDDKEIDISKLLKVWNLYKARIIYLYNGKHYTTHTSMAQKLNITTTTLKKRLKKEPEGLDDIIDMDKIVGRWRRKKLKVG